MTSTGTAIEDVLVDLVRGLPGRRVVCIGATALRAQMDLGRFTNDVDVAVDATTEELESLILPLGFSTVEGVPHRFRSARGVLVDVLPADDASIERGYVVLGGHVMSVVGFDLLATHSCSIDVAGIAVAIAAVPAIAVLKIVAFLDRPAARARDLHDLNAIFENVLSDDDDRRFDVAFGWPSIDHDHQGAYFIGRSIGRIADSRARAKVDEFARSVGDPMSPWFASMLRETGWPGDDEREARLVARFAAFRHGLDRGTLDR